MKKFRNVLIVALIAVVFIAGYLYGRWSLKMASAVSAQKAGPRILYYVDPMHPAYKSDKPGTAPDCGMKLVPVYEGGEPQSPESGSDKPGLNTDAGGTSKMPMGTIRVSPEKQQLIGVSYGEVESAAGVHKFRALGKVAFDETRIARVHARIEGWIDKVFVDFTGKVVDQGQHLLTVYSPDMLATQQEFLLALRAKDIMKSSPLVGTAQQEDSLLAAVRKRLELWDLSESQIDEVARTQKPITYITLNAPISGYVVARNAFPKQRITPDTELYTVVDLSKVWIMADVFENEVPMLRLNQAATVTLAYSPGKSIRAKVNYIQPQVDPMTRTLKVRLEAENPGLPLKPDMFVDVEFRVEMPKTITVPAEAVLDAGLRKTVFVDRGNGYLEPRQVETGERLGDRIEIRKGLEPGERIVTSGNFLIDSESQLKSAAGGMAGMQHGGGLGGKSKESAPAAGEHQQHGAPAGGQPQSGAQHQGHKQ